MIEKKKKTMGNNDNGNVEEHAYVCIDTHTRMYIYTYVYSNIDFNLCLVS